MTFEDIMKSLKKREFKPVYFFDGEETHYMDVATDYIAENVLDESERDFNQTILYGQEAKPEELSTHVKQFPMLSEYRVVIVKEAQNWSRKIDLLLPLIEHPVMSTILVINYRNKKLKGTTKLAKRIKKIGVHHTGIKLYDNKVVPWISAQCRERKIDIDPRAAALLADSIGADLSNLNKALDRLVLMTNDGAKITPDEVQRHIGISKDFNLFELQKALGSRNAAKAMFIANYFAENEKDHHVIRITTGLYYYFAKLIMLRSGLKGADNKTMASALGVHPYFVDEYKRAALNYTQLNLLEVMDILHDIDLKSKGVSSATSSHAPLMREMIARIVRV